MVLSGLYQIVPKIATKERKMGRAHCFAKPDANQHRKFLRRQDTNPVQRKKGLVG